MFYSFFISLASSRCLSLISPSIIGIIIIIIMIIIIIIIIIICSSSSSSVHLVMVGLIPLNTCSFKQKLWTEVKERKEKRKNLTLFIK